MENTYHYIISVLVLEVPFKTFILCNHSIYVHPGIAHGRKQGHEELHGEDRR